MLSSDFSFPWLESVRNLLSSTVCADIFINLNYSISNNIRLIIEQVPKDQFLTKWRTYAVLKDELKLEDYILFKFRTFNHKLPVEVGR